MLYRAARVCDNRAAVKGSAWAVEIAETSGRTHILSRK